MKYVKKVFLFIMTGILLAFSACQEDIDMLERNDKSFRPSKGAPGDKAIPPGTMPYPKIIKRTYISPHTQFDDTKCVSWRIEWPAYNGSVNTDQIPSYFALGSGSLYSFDYLQSVDPSTKQNLNFSLYEDQKLESVTNISKLWQLDEVLGIQNASFRKMNLSLSDIQYYVKERAGLFESYWKYGKDQGMEVNYQEGDFYLFKLHNDNQYGGIRIVSTSPRIIEVYWAVPN